MKKSKKIFSAALCAAMVLGMTACNQGGGSEASTTTSNTLDDDLQNPVSIDEFVEKTDELENPNLLYLGFYDMRVAGDIKPAVKLFEETYGGKIDYLQCNWGERLDKLQTMITTGQSPDMVDKENLTFPYLMNQNVYRDMTEYFEKYMSEPQWTDAYKEVIERCAWKNAHYFYPFAINALPSCLIYDAGLFESLGLRNPKELYDTNEWDWNSFKQIMSDFMLANPDAIGGVYGVLGSDFMLTTGMPLIEIDNGKVVNNINNPTIDRAANFLMELRKENFAVRGEGMWSNESEPLATGKVAFLGVGNWKIADFCKQYPEQTFEFVPYPRDPLADKYYTNLTAFSYMVPTGAPNPEGAAAFINLLRKCQVDPEIRAVVDKSVMTEKQYSQEQFDFITGFENVDNYNLVLEAYYGFSAELTDIIDTMLVNVAFQSDEQKGWTQLRTEQEGAIDAYLSEYMK